MSILVEGFYETQIKTIPSDPERNYLQSIHYLQSIGFSQDDSYILSGFLYGVWPNEESTHDIESHRRGMDIMTRYYKKLSTKISIQPEDIETLAQNHLSYLEFESEFDMHKSSWAAREILETLFPNITDQEITEILKEKEQANQQIPLDLKFE